MDRLQAVAGLMGTGTRSTDSLIADTKRILRYQPKDARYDGPAKRAWRKLGMQHAAPYAAQGTHCVSLCGNLPHEWRELKSLYSAQYQHPVCNDSGDILTCLSRMTRSEEKEFNVSQMDVDQYFNNLAGKSEWYSYYNIDLTCTIKNEIAVKSLVAAVRCGRMKNGILSLNLSERGDNRFEYDGIVIPSGMQHGPRDVKAENVRQRRAARLLCCLFIAQDNAPRSTVIDVEDSVYYSTDAKDSNATMHTIYLRLRQRGSMGSAIRGTTVVTRPLEV